MDSITLKCQISTVGTAEPVGLKITLDNQDVLTLDSVPEQVTEFSYDLADTDGDHTLVFEMFGKTPAHTVVDDQGNIVSDAMINISKISVDDIDITQVVHELSVYRHDFNGSQPMIEDKFYGDMGCNGTVTLNFTTPIYLWLLENM